MIGAIDIDQEEAKRCYQHRYGMKFKSYKQGFQAGKEDARNKNIEKTQRCPFIIPEDVLELLKKRARWIEGYNNGWEQGRKRKRRH